MESDSTSIFRIPNEEKVEYVVKGGFASVVLGSPLLIKDFGDRQSSDAANQHARTCQPFVDTLAETCPPRPVDPAE